MRILYDLAIRVYYLGILVASPFHLKARHWLRGRRGWKRKLREGIDTGAEYTWFHCSSLGEFEQGRPLLEQFRSEKPGHKILLTFFSPSGYEIRKHYEGADYICYLPLDTAGNARHFLDTVQLARAYFIKYEFWYHFLSQLREKNIPVFLISAVFRKNQIFFSIFGKWFRKMLGCFKHLYLQDKESGKWLSDHGFDHFSISGDTRFDRVQKIAGQALEIDTAKKFAGNGTVLVAGSTWPPDEELLCRYINETDLAWKFILVPHEIEASHIQKLRKNLKKKTLVYSELGDQDPAHFRVLIIDAIGLLSSLYRYGCIAYIGGGFGRGIHNTLEAAAWGIPVIFGPRYKKFREAGELIEAGAGFPVYDYSALRSILDRLSADPGGLQKSGQAAGDYVNSGTGATSLILRSSLQ